MGAWTQTSARWARGGWVAQRDPVVTDVAWAHCRLWLLCPSPLRRCMQA
jgi:hypothetical protein